MSDEEFKQNAIISSDPAEHVSRIKELEGFGLVSSHGPDGARYYDPADAAARRLHITLRRGRVRIACSRSSCCRAGREPSAR